jgi:cobalt/nickel transport system permease protein
VTSRSYLERTVDHLRAELDGMAYVDRSARSAGLLQALDPRVKMCGMLALIVAVTFASQPVAVAAVLAVAIALGAVSRVTPVRLATRVWIGVFAFTGAIAAPALVLTAGDILWRIPVLGWPITAQGVKTAVLLLLRVETAGTLAYLLVATTPWTRLLRGLRALWVPLEVVAVLAMTLRYIVLLLQAAHDMFDARRSRAVGRVAAPVARRLATSAAGVLLARSIALGDEVHLAMQARGFRGEVRLVEESRMRSRDWGALAVLVSVAFVVAWTGR